jgi:putative transposase
MPEAFKAPPGRSLCVRHKPAIAEMYLQGVSTKRATKVMNILCGLEVSFTQVYRLTAELNDAFEFWRKRLCQRFPT